MHGACARGVSRFVRVLCNLNWPVSCLHRRTTLQGSCITDEVMAAREHIEVNKRHTLTGNKDGRVYDSATGREKFDWSLVNIEGTLKRKGHTMAHCNGTPNGKGSNGSEVFVFGGIDISSRLCNQLYALQYTRKDPFSGNHIHHIPTLTRPRMNPALSRMVPVVDGGKLPAGADSKEDDDSMSTMSTSSADQLANQLLNRPKRGGKKTIDTAKLNFKFPTGDRDMVISEVSTLATAIGYENCYSGTGANLKEIQEFESSLS